MDIMKLLIASDIHSSFQQFERILDSESDVDYVVITGDLTDFIALHIQKIDEILNSRGLKALVVHGNCDPPESIDYIEKSSNMTNLHAKSIKIGKYTFHGLGGSNYTPFFTPSEYSEDELRSFTKNFRYGEKNILISHCPPYGILDLTYSGIHAGCVAVKEIINKFDVIFCGHIHESAGVYADESRIILNPGSALSGRYALFNLDCLQYELKKVK
ncbi:MAG: metallophosphoesterase [Archaeoglobaceae archaeon]|nr:metallophosphoesterase [Archaeoglobaceae archaeon]